MKAFAAAILTVTVAGCGSASAPLNPSSGGIAAQRTGTSSGYDLLYSFKGGFQGADDGRDPHAGPLVKIKDTLYGTTEYGGGICHDRCLGGTVFAIAPSGSEKIVYSFEASSKNDGKNPRSGLAAVDGTLYGTTVRGGDASCYCGTVFKVTLGGTETVLHSFKGPPDGYGPDESSLLNVNGTLYGTTVNGGAHSKGTVFAITTSGSESVVYSFSGADGAYPKATLIDVNGTLYGTTTEGGTYCGSKGGCGTVFSLTPSGTERVVYDFQGGVDDGRFPTQEALLDLNGTLYGMTKRGGKYDAGTLFSIGPTGKEAIFHSFGGKYDGVYPYGGLLHVNGAFYGTTSNGGSVSCGVRYGGVHGCGTVFKATASGTETVLHSFGEPKDGTYPYSGVIDVDGTLFSTTTAGGTHDAGTVFTVSP